jgi:hypothetical protein
MFMIARKPAPSVAGDHSPKSRQQPATPGPLASAGRPWGSVAPDAEAREGETTRPVALTQKSLASIPLFYSPSRPSAVSSTPGAASSSPLTRPIQAKLAVGRQDDPLEREADQVADTVLRMPDPTSAGGEQPSGSEPSAAVVSGRLQRQCDDCEQGAEEEEGHVQRKAGSEGVEDTSEAPAIIGETLRSGGGRPLDASARAYFEPRFGQDFSRVRVHTDEQAGASARSVNALAYTVGPDIVFGAGRYAPEAPEGRRLLAHELTHVVQQSAAQASARGAGAAEAVSRAPEVGTGARRSNGLAGTHLAPLGASRAGRVQRDVEEDTQGKSKPTKAEQILDRLLAFRASRKEGAGLDESQLQALRDLFETVLKADAQGIYERLDPRKPTDQEVLRKIFRGTINDKVEQGKLLDILWSKFSTLPAPHATLAPSSPAAAAPPPAAAPEARASAAPEPASAPAPGRAAAASEAGGAGPEKTRAMGNGRVDAAVRAMEGARESLFVTPRDETKAITYLEMAARFLDVVVTDTAVSGEFRGAPGFDATKEQLRLARSAPHDLLTLVRAGALITRERFTQHLTYVVDARASLATLAGGLSLTMDSAEARAGLEAEWARRGGKGTTALVERVANEAWGPEQQPERAPKIAVLRAELLKLQQENKVFVDAFAGHAQTRLRGILAVSEAEIVNERKKYGITETSTTQEVGSGEHQRSVTRTTYGIDEKSQDAAAMASFAALLRQKRAELDAAKNEGPHQAFGGAGVQIQAPRSPADDATKRIVKLGAEYNLLRGYVRRRYPVLFAFDEDPAALSKLGRGVTPEMASMIGQTTRDKLDAITKVRGALDNQSLAIWQVPVIVEGTKRDLGVPPQTMRDRVVQEAMHDFAEGKAGDAALLGGVMVALGIIAAIPTAGASVGLAATVTAAGVAVTGLGVYQLTRSFQSYTLASAENNTHLERAMAISQDEPGLLWLALDIAAVLLDVSMARSAFVQLKSALSAQKASKAAKALLKGPLQSALGPGSPPLPVPDVASFSEDTLKEFKRIARKTLPEEAADQVIASAEREVAGGLKVTAELPLFGSVLAESPRAQIGLTLARYAEEAYTKAFLELTHLGRVRPLTKEALIEQFGEQIAQKEYIPRYFDADGKVRALGFHEGIGLPSNPPVHVAKGVIFIAGDATLAGVGGVVVHELTHNFQTLFWELFIGQGMYNFELMAHRAQQNMLRRVAQEAGPGAVPATSRWLIDATEDQLRQTILRNYGVGISFQEGWGLKLSKITHDEIAAMIQSPEVLGKLRQLDRMSLAEADVMLKTLIDVKLGKSSLQQVSDTLRSLAFPDPVK